MRAALAVLLVLCASAAPGGELERTLASLSAPVLGGNAEMLEGVSVEIGNAVLTLDGAAEALLGAQRRIGFVFSGSGTLAITIVDGPFRQTNLTNLADDLKWKPGPDHVFVHHFDTAVFLTPELPAGVSGGEKSTMTQLSEVVDRSWERWARTRMPQLDHLLAPFVLESPRGDLMLALLWGGDGDAVYSFDGADDRMERYGRWDRATTPSGTFFYPDLTIEQPVSFDPRRRPLPAIMQTAVDLELISTDNVDATQRTTVELTALESGPRLVDFGMRNGRSKDGKDWDRQDAPITVSRISRSDGTELEFSHKYHRLLVLLPEPLKAGQKVRLTVEAEGGFLKNFSGDSYMVLGNWDYLPQLEIYSMMASFRSVVKVKDPYLPIAAGRTLRRWQEDGLNCLESEEPRPLAFPFIVVGRFEVAEERDERFDLRVYSYAMSKDRGARRLIRNGLAILDFYSNGMAPFPYGELEVIEIPYYRHFFWQAPAGIVEVTSEGLDPFGGDSSDLNTLIKRYASKGQNSRYAHEIAHQWFGNLVSWGTASDNWLSESFAEYLSYLFMSEGAKDRTKAAVQLKEWKTDVDECSAVSSIYGAPALNGSSRNQQCYTQLLYGKGPYVLHALRQDMGDEAFKKMLFFLTTQAAKKNMKVVTEDLIQFVNAVSGKDYRPWFERYVYGTEIPSLK